MSIAAPPISRLAPPQVSPDEAIRELESNLSQTRSAIIRQRVGTAALRMFAALAVALGLVAALDYVFELATVWRGLALLAVAGGSLFAAIAGWKRLVSSYTLPAAAKDAERRAAEFGQRLRTTLDYEYDVESPRPATASRGLLDALHAETHAVSRRTDWDALVDGRPLIKALALAATCFLVWCIALVAIPEFRLATGRTLLLPLQYTTVTYTPETSTIKFGQSVTVQAEVAGRPITSAVLRHRDAGTQNQWTTVELIAEEPVEVNGKLQLHGALTATLAHLKQDQEFEVLAGPSELPAGSIRVLQPLKLAGTKARIVPPAYTGRPEEAVKELNLKVLEGSNVELAITLNRPAAEGALTAIAARGAKSDDPLPAAQSLTSDGSTLRAKLTDLRKSGNYTISAKAEDGMVLDPLKLAIKVQLDRPPSVQFIEPAEELSVIPTAEVQMVAEAKDDLGLFDCGILYQIGSGPMLPLFHASAEGSTEAERTAATLMLEEHQLTFQDAISYYAYAEDNYFGQPRRVTTPLRFIDIRPFMQQFQVVNSNCNCKGQSATLEELIKRQREQLSSAFAAQQQQMTPNAELLKRLAVGEADLLAKTEEFWQGMEAIAGPIPTLQEAVEQMQDAVTSLNGAKLPEGVSAEQQALAALVKARENLRQKLNQSSCASECQRFDRQQEQKLRMPEKKEQDKQQQVAQARKKLNELAQKEREWAQQCKNCQNPSSSPSSQAKPSASSSSSASSQSSGQPMPMPSQGQPMPMPGSEQAGEKSPSETPSPDALAKAQEQLLNELKQLQEQLAQAGQQSQAGKEQAEQAAASMKEGLEELQKQNGQKASEAGDRSADQLERLAEHLAAMNAKDIGERLAQAQELAQQLAAGQEAVEKKLGEGNKSAGEKSAGEGSQGEKPGSEQPEGSEQADGEQPGEKQTGEQPGGEEPGDKPGSGSSLSAKERQLAAEAKLLAEQLAALERDAAAEPGNLGEQLAQATAENPPEEIAAAIEQAASDLEGNRPGEARRGVSQTKESLQELGQQLGAARGQFSQPELEELQKLEEQLAQLMERAERAREAGTKPSPAEQARWQELLAKLEALAGGDDRLAKALARLRASDFRGGEPLPPGVYPEIELVDAPSKRDVAKALQSKIQEAILASALMDADQPVPPQYRELVEKYYRALSDDLR